MKDEMLIYSIHHLLFAHFWIIFVDTEWLFILAMMKECIHHRRGTLYEVIIGLSLQCIQTMELKILVVHECDTWHIYVVRVNTIKSPHLYWHWHWVRIPFISLGRCSCEYLHQRTHSEHFSRAAVYKDTHGLTKQIVLPGYRRTDRDTDGQGGADYNKGRQLGVESGNLTDNAGQRQAGGQTDDAYEQLTPRDEMNITIRKFSKMNI